MQCHTDLSVYAASYGIRLIVPLVNNWSDYGGNVQTTSMY